VTNGAKPHGPAAKKRASGKKRSGEKSTVSAKRKNWVPDAVAKAAPRKGTGGS
jgi:hypothetical protein